MCGIGTRLEAGMIDVDDDNDDHTAVDASGQVSATRFATGYTLQDAIPSMSTASM